MTLTLRARRGEGWKVGGFAKFRTDLDPLTKEEKRADRSAAINGGSKKNKI